MQILERLQKTEYKTSIALGFFDGVHKGHMEVIKTAVNNKKDGEKSAVLTFINSPTLDLTGFKKPLLLKNEDKMKLFENYGVDIVYCIDFKDIKNMSESEFVDILSDTLNAKSITTGFNYHFGKGGKSGVDELKALCENRGIGCFTCSAVEHKGDVVSSTRIRESILDGNIELANEMLGYNFAIHGTVMKGNHIGTKINTPTINLPISDDLIAPHFGVYASIVQIGDHTYKGATNIGVHPTVGGKEVLCETHLLDFDDADLYGKRVSVELLHFVREEKKFSTLDELKKQIEIDKKYIETYLKK